MTALHGFEQTRQRRIDELDAVLHEYTHAASGARLCCLEREDENKSFCAAFRTLPYDDTGVFHILEHSVLCGSKQFPVKEPFVELMKGSLNTFLNALTFPDKTCYPVASRNSRDFLNLMRVYLDAVFFPSIHEKPEIFQQEGWHRELEGEGEGERLVVNGVVYNEMKGALSEPDSVLYDGLSAALFPDTTYRFESGGTPAAIPTLTYEGFLENHRRHYRPDNAYIILYGNLDADRFLGFLDERYLAPLAAKERGPLDINPLGLQAPVAPEPVVVPMATAPENACVPLPLRLSVWMTAMPCSRKCFAQTTVMFGSARSMRLRIIMRGLPAAISSISGLRDTCGMRASTTSQTASTCLIYSAICRRVFVICPGYH